MGIFAVNPENIGSFEDPREIEWAVRSLPPEQEQLEEFLRCRAWFPYRRLDHADRTHEFIRAYDKVNQSMIMLRSDLSIKKREEIKSRGRFLSWEELMAPWIDYKNKEAITLSKRWKTWTKARRCADKRGMIYGDYVAGAIFATRRRGWTTWPMPSHLSSPKLLGQVDNFEDATIPAYEAAKYKEMMRLTVDPYFTAAEFVSDPLQVAYVAHVEAEIHRVYPVPPNYPNQRGRRIWRDMQRDGSIHTSLSFREVL